MTGFSGLFLGLVLHPLVWAYLALVGRFCLRSENFRSGKVLFFGLGFMTEVLANETEKSALGN